MPTSRRSATSTSASARRPVPVVALDDVAAQRARRCSPRPRRVAERLPGRAEHRRLAAAATRAGAASCGSACSAPRARRPPTSPACCAARTSTACRGRGWRCSSARPPAVLGTPAPRADHRRRAGRRPRRGPAAGRAAGGRRAARRARAACSTRAALTEDVAEQLLLGPIGGGDIVVPAPAAARAAASSIGPTQPVLLAPALLDPLGAAVLPDQVRRPVGRVAAGAGRRSRRRRPTATPEDVLWAVWHAAGLAARWQQASAAGGAVRCRGRPRPRRRRRSCSTRRPASPTGCPGAELGRLHRAPGRPADPRRRAGHRRRRADRGGHHPHRARQQGPRVGSRLRRPRAGGQLARSAPARLAARLRAARRRARRPRHRLRACPAPQLAEERRLFYVAATRARAASSSSPRCRATRSSRRASSTSSTRSTASARSPPPHRGTHLTGLVAELRAAVVRSDRPTPLDREAAAARARRGWPQAGVRGADPDEWWGLAPSCPTTARSADPDAPGAGQPVAHRRVPALRAAVAAAGPRRARRRHDLGLARHARPRGRRDGAARRRPMAELEAMLDEQWAGLDFGARWYRRQRARAGRARSSPGCSTGSRASRAELELVDVEQAFAAEIGDARAHRAGRPARARRRGPPGRRRLQDRASPRSRPTNCPSIPQLGAYQLAVEAGGFGDGRALRRRAARPAGRPGRGRRAAAGPAAPTPRTPTGSRPRSPRSPRGCGATSSPPQVNTLLRALRPAACCPLLARPGGR